MLLFKSSHREPYVVHRRVVVFLTLRKFNNNGRDRCASGIGRAGLLSNL